MHDREEARFRAVTGLSEGFGATPEQALAALMRSLAGDAPQPIVIWPYNQGDAFFSDAQQRRLQDLKSRRLSLTAEEQAELEGLVASAFDASIARPQALLRRSLSGRRAPDIGDGMRTGQRRQGKRNADSLSAH